MKKALLSVLCFLIVFSSFSQDEERGGYKDRCLILKWAPGSLTTGKITAGGEYNFKKKHSLEVFFGFPAAMNHKIEYDHNTSTLSTQAFSFLAGYRYYFGKKPHSGMYIEPYYKYLHHQASGMLRGDLNGESATFDTHTDYKGMGVGAQLGVQFLIVDRICLDFFILGPEANFAKFYTTATDVSSSIPWTTVDADEAEQDIKDVVKVIPIVGNKIEVQVDQNAKTVTTSYKGFVPGIRFGASIGIRL
jgi:hypothetical protein